MNEKTTLIFREEIDKHDLSCQLRRMAIQHNWDIKMLDINSYLSEKVNTILKNDFHIVYLHDAIKRVKTQGCKVIDKWCRWDEKDLYYRMQVIIELDKYQVDNAEIIENYER